MKWFKHDTSARHDTKLKLLKKKFGAAGYGVYFELLEIVGENIKDNNQQEWGFVEEIHTVETLADESGLSPDKLRTMLGYMNELGLIFKIDGRLCAPKILSRLDEYAQKRKGKFDVLAREDELNSKHRDSVGTVSGESRALEQIRTDKNRTDEKREETRPSPDDLTEEVCKKIAEDYKLPFAFVMSKADDLRNYCEAKGKSYKNYPAALRNWVKRDAERMVIATRMPSKSVDATEGASHEITQSS